MAEKEDKKEKKEDSGKTAEEIFIIIFVAIIVGAFVMRGISFFTPNSDGSGISNSYIETLTGGPNGWFANSLHFLNVALAAYITTATIYSMIIFLAILYVAWLTKKLSTDEKKNKTFSPVVKELPSLEKQKWEKVLAHVNSTNPAEWRLAILEADVLLDDLTQKIGLHGDTLGERLKNVSKGDFKTLDIAWEAHKIRNAIAHEGSDFLLSQRESKRVIDLFGTVFKEFSYV